MRLVHTVILNKIPPAENGKVVFLCEFLREAVKGMDGEIKETLKKQVRLLSERSQSNATDSSDVARLSEAMVSIVNLLISLPTD